MSHLLPPDCLAALRADFQTIEQAIELTPFRVDPDGFETARAEAAYWLYDPKEPRPADNAVAFTVVFTQGTLSAIATIPHEAGATEEQRGALLKRLHEEFQRRCERYESDPEYRAIQVVRHRDYEWVYPRGEGAEPYGELVWVEPRAKFEARQAVARRSIVVGWGKCLRWPEGQKPTDKPLRELTPEEHAANIARLRDNPDALAAYIGLAGLGPSEEAAP